MNATTLAPHDALGLVAGALTTLAFVPQVVRIVRTRSAYDISWGMFSILAVGSALWLWYGIRLDSLPLIATNVITLTLQITIFMLKWRYGRGPAPARTHPQLGEQR